jgi:hypothetical protein
LHGEGVSTVQPLQSLGAQLSSASLYFEINCPPGDCCAFEAILVIFHVPRRLAHLLRQYVYFFTSN